MVFLATSTKTRQRVAIKVTKTSLGYRSILSNWSALQQANREVECLRNLSHPFVLQLLDEYDFTDANGGKGIAIVTDYCDKGNLQNYLERCRPDLDLRLKWRQQLAEGMKYIHSHPSHPSCTVTSNRTTFSSLLMIL